MIHMGQEGGSEMTIAESVRDANLRQQDRFADRILRYFGDKAKNVTLGVWGLAFKARTDDIRESPAIHCIEQFLKAGMTDSGL